MKLFSSGFTFHYLRRAGSPIGAMAIEVNEKTENGDIESIVEADKSPITPYDEKSHLDEDGLERTVTKDDIKLHPQPTTDPLDPLNWSWFQKHSILGIVMFKYNYSYCL